MPFAKPSRYLALALPFLPANRLRRISGSSRPGPPAPLVFVEKIKGALRLGAVDRRAMALGLGPGLTLADARARVPDLHVHPCDPMADAALLDEIADFCDRYTPLMCRDGDDGLMLDITGCAHLWDDEAGLRIDLLRRLEDFGIDGHASIAGTPEAARVLARFGGPACVEPGGEAAAVAPLPVAALDIAGEMATALRRAGLKTIGDLAARPTAALAARFGSDLVVHLARILGRETIPITPRRPPPQVMAERGFAEPIGREEDILAVLERLAGRIATMLEARGAGGRRFEASVFRVDGHTMRLTVETALPMRNPKALIRLFRARLGSLADPLDPGFGFDLVRLAVLASEPLAPAQIGLDGKALEEEAVADLIDRLAARHGRSALSCFEPVDTHMPEAAARRGTPFGGPAKSRPWPAPAPGMTSARPLFLFDPPQPITTLAEVPEGPPRSFRWRRVRHEVTHAEGPERIAPQWWSDAGDAETRDYYRVEDAAGRRFWVFREGLYDGARTGGDTETSRQPRWFLHGMFA